MYIPKYFKPYELVDKETYKQFSHNSVIIYNLFDENILRWADWMRDEYGPMIINNWKDGGDFEWSGYRNPRAGKYYSKSSMHSFAKALDLKPTNHSARFIIDDLKKRIVKVPFVTRIEDLDGMTWVHGDTKFTSKNNTHFFKP